MYTSTTIWLGAKNHANSLYGEGMVYYRLNGQVGPESWCGNWGNARQILYKKFSGILVLAAMLNSCAPPRLGGPKRIEADGVTYVACQGVLWAPNNSLGPRDSEPPNFEVRFRDAQGVDHDLKRVRILHVTDLPLNTPECLNQR